MSKKPLVEFDEHGVFQLDGELADHVFGGAGERIVAIVKGLVNDPNNHVCVSKDVYCGKDLVCSENLLCRL